MQNETPFQIALIIALAPFLVVRTYYRIKTRTFSKESFPKDSRVMLKILLFILVLTFVVMIMWLINSDLMRWASFSLPGWIRWGGMILSLAATSLLFSVHQILGKSYSPKLEIKEKHNLVTTGPYRYVRHPMYSAIFCWTLGLALIISNWTTIFLPLAFALYVILRLPKEEMMMIDKFGGEYKSYMNRTGRIIPNFFRKDK